MFPNKSISLSDTESNPLRQYQIKNSDLVNLEKNVTLKCGENLVKQNFF